MFFRAVVKGSLSLLLVACGGLAPLAEDPDVVSGCLPEGVGAGEARAKRVECAEELPAGLLAAGRVGDIVLENAKVKVVVRGFGEGLYFPGTTAGGIVDAARIGGEDLVLEIMPLVELGSADFDEVFIVEAGGRGPATVAMRGPAAGIPILAGALSSGVVPALVEVRYILEPDAEELRIETLLHPLEGESARPTVQIGDLLLLGGKTEAFLPGVGAPTGLTGGDFIAVSGTDTSYALTYAGSGGLQDFEVRDLTAVLGPHRAVGGGDPAVRWLAIGDGSVASAAARAWERRGEPLALLTGTSAPGVDVVVSDAAARPVTVGRADAEGRFRIELPPGSYTARAESPGRGAADAVAFDVAAGGAAEVDVPAGPSGTLSLAVEDEDGTPLPARVVVSQDGAQQIHYTGASGSLELPLPPGSYTLDVSRGVEYDAFTASPLEVADGEIVTVPALLNRVVDTAGWISIDTHMHSELSLDSSIPLEDRLLAIAAEGVEIALSTDHDYVTDYGPVVEALGLGDWLSYVSGVETSSLAFGHVNAWPIAHDPDRAGGGAFGWYGRSPDQVFALMRERGDHVVIQVNHPRRSSSGLLHLIGFDRETGLATREPAALGLSDGDFNDLNFDALEVANSFNATLFPETFADWLALVALGHPATATGSSDSHGKSSFTGNSRTYVYVGPGADDPTTVDLAAVDAALKARKAVVSQGAFVTAAIVHPQSGEEAEPGALVDLSGQTEATLRVVVQAPPWMPLARVVVYGGRIEALSVELDPGDTEVLRFDEELTLPLDDRDSFFVVLVEAAGRGDPVLGRPDASFTNPLLYDRDGDGLWSPLP